MAATRLAPRRVKRLPKSIFLIAGNHPAVPEHFARGSFAVQAFLNRSENEVSCTTSWLMSRVMLLGVLTFGAGSRMRSISWPIASRRVKCFNMLVKAHVFWPKAWQFARPPWSPKTLRRGFVRNYLGVRCSCHSQHENAPSNVLQITALLSSGLQTASGASGNFKLELRLHPKET